MWRKTFAMVSVYLVLFGHMGGALAYDVTEVINGATIAGRIAFTGTAPAPRHFEVKKNPEVCGHDRALTKVEVNNGFLKGAVIALEGVQEGKPFEAKSFRGASPNDGAFLYDAGKTLDLDIQLKNCNFGPFTGVLAAEETIRVANQDSIKHVLHTYVVKGRKASILKTVHNKNLPAHSEREEIFQSKKLKHGRVVALTCDRHDFMENWMYLIDSPYFAISDQDGQFTIDQVPPGRYDLVAWHPVLGTREQVVTVTDDGNIRVNFEFSKK